LIVIFSIAFWRTGPWATAVLKQSGKSTAASAIEVKDLALRARGVVNIVFSFVKVKIRGVREHR
jgi:hypothetical protein